MPKENCWVWFKGSIKEGGQWKGGFTCTKDEKSGILIESPNYVSCRVPEWRVRTSEPTDINEAPNIPKDTDWKII
tara:strand:+ start:574 stop:798 length:225 start_codon:yes stop_codon:yes gene_type:complete